MSLSFSRVAVLIPCFNEAATIAGVVQKFRAALPDARLIVYDNNSTDGTAEAAQKAGAEVKQERRQGKGYVVRRMFADIDADVYLMVDGDATYDVSAASVLVASLLRENLALVVGVRQTDQQAAYRDGHRFGNRLLTCFAGWLFGQTFTDILSGYRAMSRGFVKSFPAHAAGFDIEMELAVHALELRLPVLELPTSYSARPSGSHSKLKTYRDGWKILKTLAWLAKNGRPLAVFSTGFALCIAISVILAIPVLYTYIQTGLVPRFPTAILSASLMLLASIFLVCGLILDMVALARREQKYAMYLMYSNIKNKER